MDFLLLTFIAVLVNGVLWMAFASNTQTRILTVVLLFSAIIGIATITGGHIFEGWRFWVALLGVGIPSIILTLFPFMSMDGTIPNNLKGFIFFLTVRITPLLPWIFFILYFVI